MGEVTENLGRIWARMQELVGRDNPARLVAVTKNVAIESILEAYHAGQRDFGESRWQDAEPKILALPSDIRWHFIGTLQSNKAARISRTFQYIHSLDSLTQVSAIEKSGNPVSSFVQVNIDNEPQKSGIPVKILDKFIADASESQNVRLIGLMTIGSESANLEERRMLFRQLRDLGHASGLKNLSMGMSGDWEVALQEGATHIRIGAAIFGNR